MLSLLLVTACLGSPLRSAPQNGDSQTSEIRIESSVVSVGPSDAVAGRPLVGVCDGISTALETPLTSVRVARGSCTTDNAVSCTASTTCRFCVNDHSIPCTSNSQCASVGGACSPSGGTCVLLVDPLYVTSPAGDTHRIFIVEQDGRIRIVKDGAMLTTPFLNIDPIVRSTGDEEGLLGLAFSPTYGSDGLFFVYYTRGDGNANLVARYHVSGNPDVADPASGVIVLTIPHPSFDNHNGGGLQFGPDGYLYVGTGDGGSGCDPGQNAQNTGELKGKMLRIDVVPPPAGPPHYRIPPTNPYVGPGNPLDEILSIGLRNPWRFSFDRLNGDLYIGDVGQYTWEEIDYRPSQSIGGENFGWENYEGFACPAPDCDLSCSPINTRVDPVKVYAHVGSNCAVTGGYVYRGCRMPGLAGRYFYADYCAGSVSSFVIANGTVTSERDHTTELAPVGGFAINFITSFGVDARGELYLTDRDGEVFKIVPVLASLEVSGLGATPFLIDTTWTWEDLRVSSSHPISFYRIYRSNGNGSGIFTCIHRSTGNFWTGGDPQNPVPGSVFSYLVTAVRTGPPVTETSPGRGSNGAPRALSAAACP